MSTRISQVADVENMRGAARDRRPTGVERLARFVCRSGWENVSEPAREQLKLRGLDSLGVAFGALDGEPVAMVREQLQEFGGAPLATLIGGDAARPIARLSTTGRSFATWTSTTPTWRQGRPATRATTSRRCSPPPNTRTPTVACC